MVTVDKAEEIIEGILSNATEADERLVMNEFLGLTDELVGGMDPMGRHDVDPVDPKDLNFKVFNLMELAESVHDCAGNQRQIVMESLEVDLPRLPNSKMMKIDDVGAWDKFHEIMTTAPTLNFSSKDVRNPLFGRSFMTTSSFTYDEESTVEAEFARYLKDREKLDVWCFKEAPDYIIELAQIARVCRALRKTFGEDPMRGNDMTFMPDVNDNLVRIILGLTVAHEAFVIRYNKYGARFDTVSDTDPTLRLREQMLGSKLIVHDSDKAELDLEMKRSRGCDAKFTCRCCDASMMDASNHIYGLHDAATGNVFHDKSKVQITLLGGADVGAEQKYSFVIYCNPPLPERPGMQPITYIRKDVTSTTVDKDADWFRVHWHDADEVELDHSKDRMKGDIDLFKKRVGRERDCSVALAVKRAGDWGMIQHCKEHGMIFVTADRFAALYAAYRGVCVLFVKASPVRVPKLITKPGWSRNDPRQPTAKAEFLQYTFSMFSTDTAKTALRFYADDVPSPVLYGGGANDEPSPKSIVGFVHIVLATVTVTMALINSYFG